MKGAMIGCRPRRRRLRLGACEPVLSLACGVFPEPRECWEHAGQIRLFSRPLGGGQDDAISINAVADCWSGAARAVAVASSAWMLGVEKSFSSVNMRRARPRLNEQAHELRPQTAN